MPRGYFLPRIGFSFRQHDSVNMKDAAAFKATYSDLKLIKGRKVVQLVFEVPLEGADEAYSVLGGMPNPAAEVWCAIARLNISGDAETREADSVRVESGAASRPNRFVVQCAIVCGDPSFWRFLNETYQYPNFTVAHKDDAATLIRILCDVKSRSEIEPDNRAGEKWRRIYDSFVIWQKSDEFVELA